jgi:hypothetical protein
MVASNRIYDILLLLLIDFFTSGESIDDTILQESNLPDMLLSLLLFRSVSCDVVQINNKRELYEALSWDPSKQQSSCLQVHAS